MVFGCVWRCSPVSFHRFRLVLLYLLCASKSNTWSSSASSFATINRTFRTQIANISCARWSVSNIVFVAMFTRELRSDQFLCKVYFFHWSAVILIDVNSLLQLQSFAKSQLTFQLLFVFGVRWLSFISLSHRQKKNTSGAQPNVKL